MTLSAIVAWAFSIPAAWIVHDLYVGSWLAIALGSLAWLVVCWLVTASMTCLATTDLGENRDGNRFPLMLFAPYLALGSWVMFHDVNAPIGGYVLAGILVAWTAWAWS